MLCNHQKPQIVAQLCCFTSSLQKNHVISYIICSVREARLCQKMYKLYQIELLKIERKYVLCVLHPQKKESLF